MPVHTPHPTYAKAAEKWKRQRLIVEGEDPVKEAGTVFLPMLEGQNKMSFGTDSGNSYESYKLRASFFAATGRTVEGIEGAVFRKDPVIEFPESRKDFLDSVGKEGTPLYTFAKKVFNNNLTVGRHGVLLDIKEGASAVDAPYMVGYIAESILNWRTAKVDGKEQVVMVTLKENTLLPDPEDPFTMIEKKTIRALHLGKLNEELVGASNAEKLYYYVEIWEKVEGKKAKSDEEYTLSKTIIPTIRGKKLNYIPFIFFGPKELSANIQKSPIADIVSINESHYRTSADLEHGRHFTALPTAWVAGFPIDTELLIGSTTAWVSEDPSANAGFLEFTGQGLGALEKALEHKEAQMAVLGARLLEEPKKSVESADTHMIRKGGEESVTASLSRTTSAGFTQLLLWSAEWMGVPTTDISCELNRDYSSVEMSPQMLMALMAALQSGHLSQDTWIYNLKRGEILPEGRTPEEELDLILEHPPVPKGPGMDLGKETPQTPKEIEAAKQEADKKAAGPVDKNKTKPATAAGK